MTLATRKRGEAHTLDEVAQILKISKRQVIREVRAGKLKANKFSERVVRVFDDALDAYVAGAQR